MAIIPAPPIFGKCPLKLDDSAITLKVVVGQGQLSDGTYTIKPSLQLPPTATGVVQSDLPIALGTDKDIYGQRLSLLITVAATQSLDTNILIELTGGKTDISISIAARASQIGDVVAYEAYFRFTKS